MGLSSGVGTQVEQALDQSLAREEIIKGIMVNDHGALHDRPPGGTGVINRLKQFRRIATRFEKKAENYLAMLRHRVDSTLVIVCKHALV